DSLSAIARRFSTSVAQLASLNQLADRNALRIGQRLVLPQDSAAATGQNSAPISATAPRPATPSRRSAGSRPDSYGVRRGDTLSTIARRYGVSEAALLQANNLDNPNRIFPGQVLRFPGAGDAAQSSAGVQIASTPAAPAAPEVAEVAE